MAKASGLRRFDLLAQHEDGATTQLGYNVSSSDIMMLVRACKDPTVTKFELVVLRPAGVSR
jgi:hypothetical protein